MDNLATYRNKNVLVTGHTGFMGGWLSFWLSELGANVIGYSLDPPSKPNLFEAIGLQSRIEHIHGDIRDRKFLEVMKKHRPEFVFHLAAQSLVRVSYSEPRNTYDTNVMGTVNVLESVRDTDSVRACLVVTSDKCYDNIETTRPYRESDPMGGHDPYSSSKGCTELLINAYRKSFFNNSRTALSSLRLGNVIGGGDWGEDRLVPDCVRALSKGEPVRIRNPRATRPWQYILEPLYGALLLGTRMLEQDKRFSGGWNFGCEKESNIMVEDLVKIVMKHWEGGKYETDNSEHPHESVLLGLDSGKSKSLLGWKPLYDINEALRRTIRFYREYYDGNRELDRMVADEIREYTGSVSGKQ